MMTTYFLLTVSALSAMSYITALLMIFSIIGPSFWLVVFPGTLSLLLSGIFVVLGTLIVYLQKRKGEVN